MLQHNTFNGRLARAVMLKLNLWPVPEKFQRGAGCQPAKTAADWQSAPRSHVAILLEWAIRAVMLKHNLRSEA